MLVCREQIHCLIAGARAQNGSMPCDAFVKNSDGSWTVTQAALIPGPDVRVRPGSIFRPGSTLLGVDIAARLDEACPAARMAPPPPAAGAVPAPQPGVPLSRYADANGNIDVQRLTCGQLAEASGDEADSFFTWYSGWYTGFAKKRGINLARVRYAVRSVVEYCKANRDKSLVQAMELMLK